MGRADRTRTGVRAVQVSTPIFDQLVRELGFVENSELPAVRDTRAPTPFGYTLADLYALKAAVARYQVRQRLPVSTDQPYYVNCDNQSLQKVTIQPPSDMVKRCPPSKENCMTLDEIPGGQEHGVIIPAEPKRTHRVRFIELLARNSQWVQRYTGHLNYFEFQHNDGRGVVVQFDGDGSLQSVKYFDLGQPTTVVPDGDDFTTLTTAILARAYWPEHVRRVEAEDEIDAESIRRAQANPDLVLIDEAFDLETEQSEAKTGSLHDHSDGKFLNPGAVIANRHHATEEAEVVESGGATFRRNPATGAVSVSTDGKFPKVELPDEVIARIQEKVKEAGDKLGAVLGVDPSQPTSILPQGHEHEILREAATTISTGRQDDYGHAEDSFATIAGMWEHYLSARFGESVELDGRDVAMMMSLLKVARDAASRKRDNLVDLAGYAALAERATRSDR